MRRASFLKAASSRKLVMSRAFAAVLITGFGAVGAYLTLDTKAVPLNGHEVVLDNTGRIIPWGSNPANTYDDIINRAWNYLINDVPNGTGNNQPAYLSHCCVFASSNTPSPWMNNPAGSFSMLIESATRSYAYNGDARPISIATEVADHMLNNGLTPSNWSWSRVPFSTGEAGDLTYNGGGREGVGTIEPDKVSEFGYALLTLYKFNGSTRYRDEAIRLADVMASKVRTGSQNQSPWPFRIHGQTNSISEQYTANMLPSIQLFDELIKLGLGNTTAYQSARTTAWNWMMTFPMQNNVWTQYFEDVFVQGDYRHNLNQLIPMNTARYLLEHPEFDSNWQTHVRSLITFVENTFAQPQFGANAIGEQITYNLTMGSHTARYASVNAMLYEKTGDQAAREKAYRAFNWATYLTRSNGMVLYHPDIDEFWFTDGYGDYIKHFIAGMGAVPEWAPANQSRMTRSTSVVKSVIYNVSNISYVTADAASQEVFRLHANPTTVTAGGQTLLQRSDMNQPGWTYDATNKILRIRHDSAANVQITMGGQNNPLPVVTFSANPTQVVTGLASTLTWSATNATTCSASGGWSGTRAVSGSESTGNLTANQTYNLSCTGAGGTTAAMPVTITVTAAPPLDTTPPTVTMSLPGVTFTPGQTAPVLVRNLKSITWQPLASDASGIRTLTLTVNGQTVTLTNGNYVFGNGTTDTTRNGDYALRAVAVDNNNNTTTVNLTIQLRHPDFNRSGRVDISDVGALMQRWMQASTVYDLNVSGQVNISDVGFLMQNWLSTQ